MIFYKNILGKMSDAGYNTNRLRCEHILSESAIARLRHNEPINICTLDLACKERNGTAGKVKRYEKNSIG